MARHKTKFYERQIRKIRRTMFELYYETIVLFPYDLPADELFQRHLRIAEIPFDFCKENNINLEPEEILEMLSNSGGQDIVDKVKFHYEQMDYAGDDLK